MAEQILSAGVYTNEVDQSFLPPQPVAVGAAIIGPTVKGPVLVPVTVTSFSEYEAVFGRTFSSGSDASEKDYEYFTSLAAKEYLRYGNTLTVVRIAGNGYAPATADVTASGVDNTSFTLETLADGADQNSESTETTNGLLPSGSVNNLRWEVTNVNDSRGTFTLLIRRGDDTTRNKVILEQYNNLTLDPNSPNYLPRVVGDQNYTIATDGTTRYLQLTGSYPNRSRYVRVVSNRTTINYLDNNGNVRLGRLSGSLPAEVSGTFSGGNSGLVTAPAKFYQAIEDGNVQGLDYSSTTATSGGSALNDAISLLSNRDEFNIDVLMIPGLISNTHTELREQAISMVESRGDTFLILDPVLFGSTVSTATAAADAVDTSYAAMYYPWVKIPAATGENVWVPPSVVVGGVFAFNDVFAAPWFAPAGLNRGTLDNVIQAERKLTKANRDTLYDAGINPIATFPNAGVTIYGQKTLQKKASALDRINVRRLLIAAKRFVSDASRQLVFEQNSTVTRNRFLNIVNPYFENVQQRQGLYAFRVIMDETNNTPDVIDRNQLVGQIYLQPTRTAEFILLDFIVQPTGAEFPS